MAKTGFCGWLGGGVVAAEGATVLARMFERLAAGVLPRTTVSSAQLVEPHSTAAVGGSDVAHDGRVYAALDGELRWSDADLATVAAASGDAQALLAAYAKFGEEFVSRLRGSFAVAVLVPAERLAILAVDRFGTKPLCWKRLASGTLIFGSTADAVRAYAPADHAIEPQSVLNYCFFHIVPSPSTIYSGQHKLEMAQMLVSRGDKQRIARYWVPRFAARGDLQNEAGLAQELRASLEAAVARCAPDGGTGAFLSGGLDSSTVAGFLQRLQHGEARTYTVGFAVPGYDEMPYARAVVRHFGLRGNEHYMDLAEVERAIPLIASSCDEPFGNSSAAAVLACAEFAHRDGIQHMIAGDGGDELFAGNSRYAKQQLFQYYHSAPRSLRAALERLLLGRDWPTRAYPTRKLKSYIEQALVPMPLRIENYNFLRRSDPSQVFDVDFLHRVRSSGPEDEMAEAYNAMGSADVLDRMLYLDWKFTLADNDLRKVNTMCGLAGVRVSYPMLDDEVVDLSTRVPPNLKLKGLKLRYFYKRAFADFLPPTVISKPKHGFGLPVGEWFATSAPLRELAGDSLVALKARGFFLPQFLDELLAAHRADRAYYYAGMVWVLVILEMWLQAHGYEAGRRLV